MNLLEVVLKGTDQLSAPVEAARGKLQELGSAASSAHSPVQQLGSHMVEAGERAKEAESKFAGLKDGLKEVAAVAGGIVAGNVLMSLTSGVGEQFKGVTTEVAAYSEQVRVMAQTTGMTTEQSSHLILAMKDMGVGVDQGNTAMRRFANSVGQAQIALQEHQKTLPPAAKAYAELGISLTNTDGSLKSTNDLLYETADAFAKMPDSTEKAAVAQQLFGRTYQDMLPLLDQGSEGLKETAAAADKYGITLTGANVGAVRQFVLAHKDMDAAIEGVRIRIGTALIPMLSQLIEGLSNGIVKVEQWLTHMNDTYHITDIVGEALGRLGAKIQEAVSRVSVWTQEHSFDDWVERIVGGAGIVIEGLGGLGQAFGTVLGGILNIVVTVGQEIYQAFSWLNPFAEHSPSLVSQVQDGVGAIGTAFGQLSSAGEVLTALGQGPVKDLGAGLTEVSQAGKKSLDDLSKSIGNLVTEAQNQLNSLTTELSDAKTALTNFGSTPLAGQGASNDAIQALQEKINQSQLLIDQQAAGGGVSAQQGMAADLAASKEHLTEMGKQTKGNADAMASLRQHISEVSQALANTKSGALDPDSLKAQLAEQQAQLKVLQDQAKVDFGPQQYQVKKMVDAFDPLKQEKPFDQIVAGIEASGTKVQDLTPKVAAQKSAVDTLKSAWDNVKTAIDNVNVAQAAGAKGAKGGGGIGGLPLPTVPDMPPAPPGGGAVDPNSFAGQRAAAFAPRSDLSRAMEGMTASMKPFTDNLANAQQKIQAFGDAINSFAPNLEKLQPIFTTIGNAVRGLVSAFEQHQSLQIAVGILAELVLLAGPIGAVAGAIEAIGAAFGALSLAGGAGGAAGVLSVIVGLLGGPVTIALFAIVGIITLVALAWSNNWGDIRGKTQAVVDFFTTLPATISGIFQQVVDWFKNNWQSVIPFLLVGPFGIVVNLIRTHGDEIKAVFAALPAAIGNIFEQVKNAVMEKVTAVLTWIKDNWQSIVPFLTGPFGVVINIIRAHGDEIKAVFLDIKQKFQDMGAGLLAIAGPGGIIGSAFSQFGTTITGFLTSAQNVWTQTWDGIGNKIDTVWTGMIATVKTGINTILGYLRSMIQAFDNVKITIPSIDLPTPTGPLHLGGGVFSFPYVDPGLIPTLAAGTSLFAGGAALVGEQGPELVNLPGGTSVMPAKPTARAIGSGDTFNVTFPPGLIFGTADQVADAIHQSLLRLKRTRPSLGLG